MGPSQSLREKRTKSTRVTLILLALVVASWSGNLLSTQNWTVLFKNEGPEVRVVKMSDSLVQSMDHYIDDESTAQNTSSSNSTTDPLSSSSSSSAPLENKTTRIEPRPVTESPDLEKGKASTKKNQTKITDTLENAPGATRNKTAVVRLEKNSTAGNSTLSQLSHQQLYPSHSEEEGSQTKDSGTGVETALEQELLKAWEVFEKKTNSGMKEILEAVKRANENDDPNHDVTVATFATPQQLPHLLNLVARWNGPIQVAVYLTNVADILRFTTFHQRHHTTLENAGFHVLFEKMTSKQEKKYLPDAALHNLAMNQVDTPFLINLDVEYITSSDCYETLIKMIRSNPRVRAFLEDRYIMVIPAFENRSNNKSLAGAPSTKKDILEGRENKTLDLIPMPFLTPRKFPTRYGMWSQNVQTGDMFQTEYETGYEPVVLAHRKLVPQYYSDLRGPWYSQVAWMEEMDKLGYFLGVLRHVFAYRVEPKEVSEPAPFAKSKFDNFRKMVRQKYDYPLIVDTVHSIGRRDYGSCLDPTLAKEDAVSPTSRERRIMCEWQNFTESPDVRRQVVGVIYHGTEHVDGEITLATQGSVDRLKRLIDGTTRWNGPISVAVLVTSEECLTELFEFYRSNSAALKKTTFHLFFEKVLSLRDENYPHNYLRNLAMNNVETEYVINIDIDFCLNENAHTGLVNLLQSDKTVRKKLDNRTMLVLPAFENTYHVEEEDASLAPKDKADVTEQVKVSKTAEAFHLAKYFAGHGSTNFEKWFANKTGNIFDTEYEWGFEPYVLARKDGLPLFWTRFRGFGYNKRAWLEEAHRMGYKFSVLRDYFVFHVGQSSTQIQAQSWVKREYKERFSVYLDNNYPK